jgi:flagellar operon protein
LNRGVGQAAQKGAKDSLVLLDNLALLVNIRNRVVVTAMDDARTRENVFTQIDSTVIV